MEPTDQEMYDQLLGYLAAQGSIVEDTEPGIVIIEEYDHRRLDQPLRLHLTAPEFGNRLREMGADAQYLRPDADPTDAAWGLFLVHLDEAVATARPGETELRLGRGGVDSVRPDGTRTPFPPEVQEYIELNEYYERLIQYYADRGELEIGIGNDVLTLYHIDGHAFAAPLRLRISSAVLRDQMRRAEDREAALQRIIEQIDQQVSRVDPRTTELELGTGGIVARTRAD
ncbi:hypothetical protein [Actinomycetospora sp. TBRC 11914]|uniref:hypothetical protein n=1 Tax=Actinomycetospora sp. TBRC 11914 TaxID=2729387 RepID=UPI00145C91D7|nr:hypothetical protein [Actinomycetospora sp. TBRC 11914]NMO93200.1 hypothetical protein [Actinomycetospora sp. TBRC 11914]